MPDQPTRLSDAARARLLEIARACVEAAVRHQPAPRLDVAEPELQRGGGAFVTLQNGHRLRGCIGRFEAKEALWRTVADMARAASTEDCRFAGDPITPGEVPQLDIEISVLSPMQKIANPLDIELGVHGIYVVGKRGFGAGTYLPQVATEHHMSKEEFLASCCAHKAGLRADAWRTGEADVFVYTAEVFGEQAD